MFEVKRACTEMEINDVFNLRYKVFCEEKGRIKVSGDYFTNMIIDQFDTYDSASNIIAYDQDSAVGVARINTDSEVGLPPDVLFDLSDIRIECRAKGAQIGSVSMLALDEKRRKSPLLLSLFLFVGKELQRSNIGVIVASISDETFPIYRRMGFDKVCEPVWSEAVNDNVCLIKGDTVPVIEWGNKMALLRERKVQRCS